MFRNSALFLFCAFLLSATAQAGPNFTDAKNTCTTANCQAMTLRGTMQQNPENFVMEAWGGVGDCLRFEITGTTPSFDPAMIIIGPSFAEGAVWIDDDSGSGLNPLVKLIAPVSGVYTVVVTEYFRADSAKDFTLKYGRYNGANPNCSNPTPQGEFMTSSELKGR